MTFVASLTVCLLSFREHGRSVKPSTLLTLYLVASIICDSINLASIYQGHAETRTLALLTASSGLKAILLILECLNKRSYLREPYKTLPLEQTAADLNRVFLFWMNGQIWQGHIKLLSVADLPTLDYDIKSRGLRTRMIEAWDKTGTRLPSRKTDLCSILSDCLHGRSQTQAWKRQCNASAQSPLPLFWYRHACSYHPPASLDGIPIYAAHTYQPHHPVCHATGHRVR